MAGTVATSQAVQATLSQIAVEQMLLEQDITVAAEALLNTAAFTTATDNLLGMLDQVESDFAFDQLVSSLVQDAGRAAESVAVTVRPRIGHVRNLTPPSCARCAVLAGRVYRYSSGFQRHPGCDCTMIPVREDDERLAVDPMQLVRDGLVTGLSKADQKAVLDGADLGQVVNVRRRPAGLQQSGRVLARRGRLTPEGIYAITNSREEALEALATAGYVL